MQKVEVYCECNNNATCIRCELILMFYTKLITIFYEVRFFKKYVAGSTFKTLV